MNGTNRVVPHCGVSFSTGTHLRVSLLNLIILREVNGTNNAVPPYEASFSPDTGTVHLSLLTLLISRRTVSL